MELGNEYRLSGLLFNFLQSAKADPRIGPSHICIYLALLAIYHPVYGATVAIRKGEVASWAKVSETTFHRAMKHLQLCGYINYFPSFDPCKNSTVALVSPR